MINKPTANAYFGGISNVFLDEILNEIQLLFNL